MPDLTALQSVPPTRFYGHMRPTLFPVYANQLALAFYPLPNHPRPKIIPQQFLQGFWEEQQEREHVTMAATRPGTPLPDLQQLQNL